MIQLSLWFAAAQDAILEGGWGGRGLAWDTRQPVREGAVGCMGTVVKEPGLPSE